jgi:site-specific DNA-cytosine methylase
VVVENVPGLRVRSPDRVIGEPEALSYICWRLVVSASHAGAPHRRARVWIIVCAVAAHTPGQDRKWSLAQRERRRSRPLNDVMGDRLHPIYVERDMGFPAGCTE